MVRADRTRTTVASVTVAALKTSKLSLYSICLAPIFNFLKLIQKSKNNISYIEYKSRKATLAAIAAITTITALKQLS